MASNDLRRSERDVEEEYDIRMTTDRGTHLHQKQKVEREHKGEQSTTATTTTRTSATKNEYS